MVKLKGLLIFSSFLAGIGFSTPPKVQRDIVVSQAIHFFSNENQTKNTLNFFKAVENIYSTQHFIIHYGNSYPQTDLWSDNNDNNIPDFIEEVAKIVEYVWKKEVEDLGFKEPFGGAPVNIYIANTGLYLFNKPLELDENICGFSTVKDGKAYLILNASPPQTPYTSAWEMLKITLAHEFFHLIQFSYVINSEKKNLWLYEGTAVLMERLVYPEIKDYVYEYLPEFFHHPERGLIYNDETSLHVYSTVLFFDFLVKKYGIDILKKIWLNFAEDLDSLKAVEKALGGSNYFINTLKEFYLSMEENPNNFSNSDLIEQLTTKIPKISSKYSGIVYNTGTIFLDENQNFFSSFIYSKPIDVITASVITNGNIVNDNPSETKFLTFWDKDKYSFYKTNIKLFNNEIINITLNKGWNLVNLKANITTDELNQLPVKTVWKWNGYNWEIYISNKYPDLKNLAKKYGIKFFSNINATEGFWIYSEENYNDVLTIKKGSYKLVNNNAMWQLIGNPSYISLKFSDLEEIIPFSIAWIWDEKDSQWELYIPDNSTLKDLVDKYKIPTIEELNGTAMKGFWIKK